MKNILIIVSFLSLVAISHTKTVDKKDNFVIVVKGEDSKNNATSQDSSKNETEFAEYSKFKYEPKKITVNETQKMYKFEAKDGRVKHGRDTKTDETVPTTESHYAPPQSLIAQQNLDTPQNVADQDHQTTYYRPYTYMAYKLCAVPMTGYVPVSQIQHPFMTEYMDQNEIQQENNAKNMILQYVQPYGMEYVRELRSMNEPNYTPNYENEIVGDFSSGNVYKYYQNNPSNQLTSNSQNMDTYKHFEASGYDANANNMKSVYYTTEGEYSPPVFEIYQSSNAPRYENVFMNQNHLQSQKYPKINKHNLPGSYVTQNSDSENHVYEIQSVENSPQFQTILLDQNQLQGEHYQKNNEPIYTGPHATEDYAKRPHSYQNRNGYQVTEETDRNEIESQKLLVPHSYVRHDNNGAKYSYSIYGDNSRKDQSTKLIHAGHYSKNFNAARNINVDPSKFYYRNNLHPHDVRNIGKH